MALDITGIAGSWESWLPADRARLVRLCARLTGDWDAAEDLAQETLVEAWRHADRLRDPGVGGEGRARWLAAIARNVCLRWARRQGRESANRTHPVPDDDPLARTWEEWPAGEADVEAELERDELVRLLDRALALLPPVTRRVLIESYVEGSPQSEVAARLGLSAGAVTMRLQRGKLALRRVLTSELTSDDIARGVGVPATGAWQETRIWCYSCGRRRFVGGYARASKALVLFCPSCSHCGVNLGPMEREGPLSGARANKPVLTRLMAWSDDYYHHAIEHGAVPCFHCGHPAPLRTYPPDYLPPAVREGRGMHVPCARCDVTNDLSLGVLALCLPEGRRFWREHPRIRTLPEREIEAAGGPAVVEGFESVTGAATFDVVFARDTYRVLHIEGAPDE